MESEMPFENRLKMDELNKAVFTIKNELKKVIVGQDKVVDLMIVALLANGHLLLEGVPGVAKTMVSKLLAKTISTDFSRIQFTPDLMPSDILGTTIFNTVKSDFDFKKGPVFSNMILIDEINRAPAKTQSALFEVMEERQVTIDGVCRKMNNPFIVLATQNPVEHEGTYRLPEAQMDRFLFKIEIDYPSLEEEIMILGNAQDRQNQSELEQIMPVVKEEDIVAYQQMVKQVIVEPHLLEYIAKVIAKTRKYSGLFLGASPRASLAVLNASKALAAMEGRDFVTPEDIKYVFIPVLIHRVVITPEKEMEGVTPDVIIQQIIDSVEIPR